MTAGRPSKESLEIILSEQEEQPLEEQDVYKAIGRRKYHKTPEPVLPPGYTMTKDASGLMWVFDANGKPICGARKRDGSLCHAQRVRDRNRCRLHGGKSPKGIAHPRFKTGRYSTDLTSRLAVRYEQAVNDDKLLELRSEIALMEARIGDLLTRVDSGESGMMWRAVNKTYAEMRKAAAAGDQQKFTELLNELGKQITKGRSDYAAWDEVIRAISSRRRLVESERKRLVEMKQMMTAEQAMAMLAYVTSVIKKHVTDRQTLAAISADISAYLVNPSAPQAPS